jgi:hypothetical protein
LNYSDNADNEFWVEAERCTGSGCTDFTRVAQSRGENGTGMADTGISRGVLYTYRVRALGFMGPSGYSNTVEVMVPAAAAPAAPSNLVAAMNGVNVVLNWQDNSTNESQFYIERCQGAGCTSLGLRQRRQCSERTDYNRMTEYTYRVLGIWMVIPLIQTQLRSLLWWTTSAARHLSNSPPGSE